MNKLNVTNSSSESEEEAFFYWEESKCFRGSERFFPKMELDVSSECNTVTIDLILSDLDANQWKEAILKAEEAIAKGKYLFWNLDLNLFQENFFLEHQGQFASLQFALLHFYNEIYQKFENSTLGLNIYSGDAWLGSKLKLEDYQEAIENWKNEAGIKNEDFNLNFCLFELCFHFLEELTKPIRDLIKIFILLDFSRIESKSLEARLLNKERLLNIQIIPENPKLSYSGLIKEGNLIYEKEGVPSSLGILLPNLKLKSESSYQEIEKILNELSDYRVIAEERLIIEWQGLEELIISPKTILKEGFRMIQGFLAAHGTLITLEVDEKFPQAIFYKYWKKNCQQS